MAADATSLSEYPADATDGDQHLELVRDRLAAYAASNREAIERAAALEDAATEDMLTEIQRTVDLNLYFVQSHLVR